MVSWDAFTLNWTLRPVLWVRGCRRRPEASVVAEAEAGLAGRVLTGSRLRKFADSVTALTCSGGGAVGSGDAFGAKPERSRSSSFSKILARELDIMPPPASASDRHWSSAMLQPRSQRHG